MLAVPFARSRGRRAARDQNHQHVAALVGVGILAGSAFGMVAAASARRATVDADERVHDEMLDTLDGPVGDAAAATAPAIEPAGKWWVYGPAAAAAAAAVLAAPGRPRRARRGRRAGAGAITLVPLLVTALTPALDRWLPQPPVGSRRRPVDHPVFPSGHAFRATAVALAAGYIVTREGIAPPGGVWPLAVAAPAAVGLGRLVQEKHLASDVIGGWLAGTALAAAAGIAYELARAPRRRRGWRLGAT